MNIRVPRLVMRAVDVFCDFVNVPLFRIRKHEILRIDALLVGLGIGCGIYYYVTTGSLLVAAQGVAVFCFVAMCALWFRGL